MLRRVTFEVQGEQITVTVDEEEDAKKRVREQLGVGRLPAGTKQIAVKNVPLNDLSKLELKRFYKSERARYDRISASVKAGFSQGSGWDIVITNMKSSLDEMKTLLEA